MSKALALKELKALADPQRAKHALRYFKTGKGEYGEGDQFIGVTVPNIRSIAKQFKQLALVEIAKLLPSDIHEVRLLALIILVEQFKFAGKQNDRSRQQQIYQFYIDHFEHINNWDLVDTSCRDIIGGYLLDQPRADRKILLHWTHSNQLWVKRIAIISTAAFIRQQQFNDTIKIAKFLLTDEHDLIHKAVGWMLREVGKQDQDTLISFLDKYHKRMPRTMLRYAIEKLDEHTRQSYLIKR